MSSWPICVVGNNSPFSTDNKMAALLTRESGRFNIYYRYDLYKRPFRSFISTLAFSRSSLAHWPKRSSDFLR